MSLFVKILALLKAGYSIPAWTNADAVLVWLGSISPALADLISTIAMQFQATGRCVIDLPGGQTVSIVRGDDGNPTMSLGHQESLCMAIEDQPGANGKWLEIFKRLLPFILEILPFFLTPDPAPTPTPPNPVV